MEKSVLFFIHINNSPLFTKVNSRFNFFIYFLVGGMTSSGEVFPCCSIVCRGNVEKH